MISTSLFTYSLTDGIHHLSPLQAKGAAIKAMLDHMDQVLAAWPVEEKIRVMVDFQLIGAPPITEGIPHVLAFLRRRNRNPRQQARLAYLYPRAAQGRILRGFLVIQRFLPQRVIVRFFAEGEQDKALEWLYSG